MHVFLRENGFTFIGENCDDEFFKLLQNDQEYNEKSHFFIKTVLPCEIICTFLVRKPSFALQESHPMLVLLVTVSSIEPRPRFLQCYYVM